MPMEKTATAASPVLLTFQPQNVTVAARTGDTILDAALDNHIALEHECGGNCACTTCHVKVVSGAANLSAMEEVEADRSHRRRAGHPPRAWAVRPLYRVVM